MAGQTTAVIGPDIAGIVRPWHALLITPGLFLQGFDGPLGQATACLLASVVLAILAITHHAPYHYWRRFLPALALLTLAMAWLIAVGVVRWLSSGADSNLPLAPDLFLPKMLGTLAGVWALLVGILCARRPSWKLSHGDWILIAISVHSLVGLAQFAMYLAGIVWDWNVIYRDRFAGLIGNSNVTACVCGAGCVLAWGGLLARLDGDAGERWRGLTSSMAYPLALAINVAALMLTASRVPSLITLAAMAIMIAIQFGRRRLARQVLPALVLGGAIVVAVQSQIAAGLLGRLTTVGVDMAARFEIWKHYARSIPAALWTGFGPGAFSSLNTLTMPSDSGRYALWSINSAHNIVLQLLLVGGIPYFALLTGAAALILRDVWRSPRWRGGDRTLTTLVLAAGVIPAAGSIDLALDMPGSTMLFAVLAGLAWGNALPPLTALRPRTAPPYILPAA